MPDSYICFGLSLDLTILSSVAFLFLPCANAVSFEFTVAQFCFLSDWKLYCIVLNLYCYGKSEGKVIKSCPTLCNPVDCSSPSSSVYGTLQARILEWVTTAFSRGSSQPRDHTQVSCIADRFFSNWTTREVFMVRLTNSQLHIHFKIKFQEAWHWDFDWNCINFIQSFGKKLYPDYNNFPQQKHGLSLLLDGLSFMSFK